MMIRFPQSFLFLSKKKGDPFFNKIYSKILKWGGLLYSTTIGDSLEETVIFEKIKMNTIFLISKKKLKIMKIILEKF